MLQPEPKQRTPDPLKLAALRLRNASPDAWEHFITVFDADAYQNMTGLVTAQSGEILVKQGQVQAYTRWLRIFKECDREPSKSQP
jgi:hypothetical protein